MPASAVPALNPRQLVVMKSRRSVLGQNNTANSAAGIPKGDRMENSNKNSFMMLFCALMLVKKSRMQFQDLVLVYPFTGEAQSLAQRLSGLEPAETLTGKANC